MSKQFPECPLYNHANCKQYYNAVFCALAREDRKCLRFNNKPLTKQEINDIFKTVLDFKSQGLTHKEVADRLNFKGVSTINRRGKWSVSKVSSLMREIQK